MSLYMISLFPSLSLCICIYIYIYYNTLTGVFLHACRSVLQASVIDKRDLESGSRPTPPKKRCVHHPKQDQHCVNSSPTIFSRDALFTVNSISDFCPFFPPPSSRPCLSSLPSSPPPCPPPFSSPLRVSHLRCLHRHGCDICGYPAPPSLPSTHTVRSESATMRPGPLGTAPSSPPLCSSAPSLRPYTMPLRGCTWNAQALFAAKPSI